MRGFIYWTESKCSNNESEEINSPLFNDSVLSFLKENCGIGAEKGRHISKRGQKIIPGQLILQLHVERNSPSCDQPSSSKRTEKENIPKKKANKKRKTKKNIFDDDDWICAGYGDGRRITCDIYSSNYPLECSRIQYPTEYHWDIDLDSREFECPDCVVCFQSDQLL